MQHQGWKLIRANQPDPVYWLFNLNVDPTEQNNLAAIESTRLDQLNGLLDLHNAEQAEPMWPTVYDSAQLIDKHSGQTYEPGDEYIYWPN